MEKIKKVLFEVDDDLVNGEVIPVVIAYKIIEGAIIDRPFDKIIEASDIGDEDIRRFVKINYPDRWLRIV